jgi:hypothetical protein
MVPYLQFRILEFPLNYRAEVEEYEGTVIYRTLLFYDSVFLGMYEKNVSEFTH